MLAQRWTKFALNGILFVRRQTQRPISSKMQKCHLHVIKQTSTYNPEYQKARAEKSRGSWRTLPEGTTKTCSGINGECHHEEGPELPANDKFFGNKARGKYGLNARCKVCQKIENSRRKSAKKE